MTFLRTARAFIAENLGDWSDMAVNSLLRSRRFVADGLEFYLIRGSLLFPAWRNVLCIVDLR
jgi:hypothetical protein